MATRAVSSFYKYIDTGELMPREYIQSAESTKIITDLQYVVQIGRLEISDFFYPLRTNAGIATTLLSYNFVARNRCISTLTSQTMYMTWFAWADNTVTQFTLYATDGTTLVSTTVVAGITTHQWHPITSGSFPSAGTLINLDIQASVDAGAGYVYIGGYAAWVV